MQVAHLENKVVIIIDPIKTRVRALYLAESIICGFMTLMLASALVSRNPFMEHAELNDNITSIAFFVFILAVSCITAFGTWNLFGKAFEKELVAITNTRLYLEKRSPLKRIQSEYDLEMIPYFVYKGMPGDTDHPLAGKNIDYFGFGANSALIRQVHDEGHITFKYNGKVIAFGKNIFSWDAEKIVDLIFETSGHRKSLIGLESNEENSQV